MATCFDYRIFNGILACSFLLFVANILIYSFCKNKNIYFSLKIIGIIFTISLLIELYRPKFSWNDYFINEIRLDITETAILINTRYKNNEPLIQENDFTDTIGNKIITKINCHKRSFTYSITSYSIDKRPGGTCLNKDITFESHLLYPDKLNLCAPTP